MTSTKRIGLTILHISLNFGLICYRIQDEQGNLNLTAIRKTDPVNLLQRILAFHHSKKLIARARCISDQCQISLSVNCRTAWRSCKADVPVISDQQ